MDFVMVYDGRSKGEPENTQFIGPRAWIIAFCNEAPKSLRQIKDHIQEKGGTKKDIQSAEKNINRLEDKALLFGEGGKYVTLALPYNSHW
jgi:DNA-binding PadR family transcriptional regulator